VYDLIVDLRPTSPTYLQWHAETLTADGRNAMYVPAGCAHGYQTLMDDTEVFYQVTAAYTPGVERGIRYDDSVFEIEWPRTVTRITEKDRSWPEFQANEHENSLRTPLL
jgi:dTDP-4-dehydrorhamnose 3,5-epimerase